MTVTLEHAARTALLDCLLVKPDETVLILTDETERKIGLALLQAAKDAGVWAVYTEIPVMARNGQEPPRAIAEFMKGFQVVVAATDKSLTHTDARREACRAGARIATMPGITEEAMIRCLSADYYTIARRTEKMTRILDEASQVRVVTAAGTDLEFSIAGIRAISSTGLIHSPGAFGNLPSGESYLRPLEGTARGILVVDGSMSGIGSFLESGETIRIEIENGMAVKIEGGEAAGRLDRMLGSAGPGGYTMAEFGVGTNDAARITGVILEDEKVLGTIHVAFGNNVSMGGQVNVPVHLDGIVRFPAVVLDGRTIMENGSLLVEGL